jgi:hypothetical protein
MVQFQSGDGKTFSPQGMSGTVEIKNPPVWESLMKWSSRLRSEFYASTISQMIQLQRRAEI